MKSKCNNKNTLQSAATLKRAHHSRNRVLSQLNYTVSGGKGQEMIEDFLLKGKKNAISSQKLANLTGCKSVRELQEVIAAERAAGAVILSTAENGGGYFLPENIGEVRAFIRTLESRGKNTLAALKSARNYLKSCGGEVDE